jgi:hypothetical protein
MTGKSRNDSGKRKKQDWRPSRDEKAPYISALSEALADERINPAEHDDRITRAEAATSFADLDALVADLPFEWHDPDLVRAKRADRRRFIFGGAALVGIAAVSSAGTRTWVTSGDAAATGKPGAEAKSGAAADGSANKAAAGTDADSDGNETVPTEMVQVRNWRKDTVPEAVRQSAELGVTMIGNIFGTGDDVVVKGSDKHGQWLSISFAKNSRPRITHEDSYDTSDKWLKPDEIPKVDISKLYREVKSQLDEKTQTHQLDLRYSLTAEQWLITISDGAKEFSWTLDGLKRVKRG